MSNMASQVRYNFHETCEAGINKQINWELYASYVFLSMSSYFDRDDVSMPGFAKYFHCYSDKERDDAKKMIAYQNKRGGRVVLNPIDKPSKDEWESGIDALTAALDIHKAMNKALLELNDCASKHQDPQLSKFLESLLNGQVEVLKEFGDYISQLKRAGRGLGEWRFDRMLLKLKS